MNLLFVCTGNTCRSPMAEGMLRHMIKDKPLPVEVKSAGIAASQGIPVSPQAVQVFYGKGMDIDHQSQPVSEDLLGWADLILTMTGAHKKRAQQISQGDKGKVFALKEYIGGPPPHDIHDPFGGDVREYEKCFDELKSSLEKLLQKLTILMEEESR